MNLVADLLHGDGMQKPDLADALHEREDGGFHHRPPAFADDNTVERIHNHVSRPSAGMRRTVSTPPRRSVRRASWRRGSTPESPMPPARRRAPGLGCPYSVHVLAAACVRW